MNETSVKTDFGRIWRNGLWHQNIGLVALLGLCPLLAVSNTLINGLGLGLATLATLALTNLTVSLTRGWLQADIRIPAFVVIIASVVTAIQMLMQAWLHDLYLSLGIFIPLIVTNCAILGRAEAFAWRQKPMAALADGLATGTGFCGVLIVLGALREIVGKGTLLAGASTLFGPAGEHLTLNLLSTRGFLLAVLPPGAFIGLGLLIAGKNWLTQRRAAQPVEQTPPPEASRA